eukprot:NODE_2540_length_917_cov_255.201856.p2 GENE.NODE_2540_length_917_cov_255.201856~~NODE_2540_length_917_cov_255.201856.p2  ORF type:complete len:207 (+),score=46.53 NODE_2540_length_917_cov_255.201856:13-633(+)
MSTGSLQVPPMYSGINAEYMGGTWSEPVDMLVYVDETALSVCAVIFYLGGLKFMLGGQKALIDSFTWANEMEPKVVAMGCHYLFVLGQVMCNWGCMTALLALGLPAGMAILSAVLPLSVTTGYTTIFKKSFIKAPEYNGSPTAGLIIINVAALGLVINAGINWHHFGLTGRNIYLFAGFTVGTILLSFLAGMKYKGDDDFKYEPVE